MASSATLIEERPNLEKHQPEVTDELLGEIARRIVQKFNPFAVILFGSYAWGKPSKDSDIDLMVIVDSEGRGIDLRVDVSSAARVGRLPMDVLVYTPAEIATRLAMHDFFIERNLEKGRKLFERDRPWETLEGRPTMTLLEEWIQKAENDYRASVLINRRRKDPMPDVVVFHCQQCAEKYFKAFLIHHNQSPEKTHSLKDLLKECMGFDIALSSYEPDMQFLDKFSVDPRYPGYFATIEQGDEALTAARKVRKYVRKALAL